MWQITSNPYFSLCCGQFSDTSAMLADYASIVLYPLFMSEEIVRDFSDSLEIVEFKVLRKVKKASSRMETLGGFE